VADAVVAVDPLGAALRGTVRDEQGIGVPGAVATVIDAAGAQLARADTDDDGGFAAPLDPARVRAGEHVIVLVSAPGHQPRAHRVPLDDSAGLELALVRRPALTG
jgi:hypothetical protein